MHSQQFSWLDREKNTYSFFESYCRWTGPATKKQQICHNINWQKSTAYNETVSDLNLPQMVNTSTCATNRETDLEPTQNSRINLGFEHQSLPIRVGVCKTFCQRTHNTDWCSPRELFKVLTCAADNGSADIIYTKTLDGDKNHPKSAHEPLQTPRRGLPSWADNIR